MLKKYLLVFLVSMVPLIELRGSIPIGLGMGLNPIWLYVICIIGNMLPVPIIFFFARKVLVWGSDKKIIGKFFTFCLEKGEKVVKNSKKKLEKAYIGLYSFLLEFLFLVQELGQEHLLQVFWIWILKKVRLPLWLV